MSLMERAASAEKSQDLLLARVGINALEVLRE